MDRLWVDFQIFRVLTISSTLANAEFTEEQTMPERVVLTGGSGFFGRRIAEALRRHGYDVSTPGRPDFDLMDASLTRRAIDRLRPETIVHSAAYYGGLGICMAEPTQIFHRNIVMGANLLEAAARAGVRKIMAIGSACSYPGAVAGDMKEDDFWSGRLHPSVESYGFTKKVLEVGLRAYGRGYGIVGQMPIVTNLYGEYDVFGEYRSHVAAALIKKFADAVQSRAQRVVCWGTGDPFASSSTPGTPPRPSPGCSRAVTPSP